MLREGCTAPKTDRLARLVGVLSAMPLHTVSLVAILLAPGALPAAPAPGCPAYSSHIEVASGSFSSQPGVTFRLRHFVANLVPMGKTAPACSQKMTVVSRAEIFISNESLSKLFTEKLGTTNSKIKEFKVQNDIGKVALTGKIKKLIPIQFSIEGPVTTDGTSLRVEAHSIKADGIPIKALLGLVGEHLSSVLAMKGMPGIAVEENAISFAPEQIAHLKGHIRSVETTAAGLILRY